jgi:hypothetical protein
MTVTVMPVAAFGEAYVAVAPVALQVTLPTSAGIAPASVQPVIVAAVVPSYGLVLVTLTVGVTVAVLIPNVLDAVDRRWLASPANVAVACTVPAEVWLPV